MLRLHRVAILWGWVKADLAITGGVHTSYYVLKAMMACAQVVEMASALLKRGIDHLKTVQSELTTWMEEHEYESIHQMQGSMSQRSVADPQSFLRANYLKVLSLLRAEGVALVDVRSPIHLAAMSDARQRDGRADPRVRGRLGPDGVIVA